MRDSKNLQELIRRRPTAFVLLTLIALRARRKNDSNFDDLELYEALVGDHKTYGVTQQVYRTDKQLLEMFKFSTFRATNKGTIAKLVDSTIFDINVQDTNDQTNEQLTSNQRATNEQLTTNKKLKKLKNVKNIYIYVEKFNELFDGRFRVTDGRTNKLNARLKKYSMEEILTALESLSRSKWHRGENDRNWKADPDFLLRSDEQVDKWLNKKPKSKSKKLSNDPLAVLARKKGGKF